MTYPFAAEANENYRYAFKQGMEGWDVAAFQTVLRDVYAQHPELPSYNVVVDGSFGPKTNAAVLDWQKKHTWLSVDGIAGILTQQSLCVGLSSTAQALQKTPLGLLKGIIEGESGYAVAAVSPQYDTGSRDYGAYQDNLQTSEQTDAAISRAFSVAQLATDTATKIRRQKNAYFGEPGAKTNEAAWKCAVLYHNWPVGADILASGGTLSNDPAPWVIAIGVRGVTTPAQWADFYVKTKIIYVTSWPS